MADTPGTPSNWPKLDWREKATIYLERARTVTDSSLREQFAELARRHLEMAAELGGDRTATNRQRRGAAQGWTARPRESARGSRRQKMVRLEEEG